MTPTINRRLLAKIGLGSLVAALPMGARAAAIPATVEPEIVEEDDGDASAYWHDVAAYVDDTVSALMPTLPLIIEVLPRGLSMRGDGFSVNVAGADPTGERFIWLTSHRGMSELQFRYAIFNMLMAEHFG